jgi:hypothetical protein
MEEFGATAGCRDLRRGIREYYRVSQEIHLTADPAFLLDREELPDDVLASEGVDASRPLVGFSVREPGPAAPDIDPDESRQRCGR